LEISGNFIVRKGTAKLLLPELYMHRARHPAPRRFDERTTDKIPHPQNRPHPRNNFAHNPQCIFQLSAGKKC